MNNNFTERAELILGKDNMEKLKKSHILIVGVGGVGSFCAESLIRCGIGNITIVDYADVEISDFNRQLPALISNLNKSKVDVVKKRLLDINNNLNIRTFNYTFNKESSDEIFKENYDYVVDAIDMVSSKIHLIEICKAKNIPIISSMGMGNKLDPTKIEITDIEHTHTCPLAKVVRKELRNRHIKNVKVVFSSEQPIDTVEKVSNGHRIIPGSISFMSSSGGLIIASQVIKDLVDI